MTALTADGTNAIQILLLVAGITLVPALLFCVTGLTRILIVLVRALTGQQDSAIARGRRPVLLCSARVRRHLRRLCEQTLPQLAVCSYNEIVPGIRVETIGVVDA